VQVKLLKLQAGL